MIKDIQLAQQIKDIFQPTRSIAGVFAASSPVTVNGRNHTEQPEMAGQLELSSPVIHAHKAACKRCGESGQGMGIVPPAYARYIKLVFDVTGIAGLRDRSGVLRLPAGQRQ
jgi:hypothetical protein